MRDVVTVLLAGGAGERLYPLTRDRAKPAVPFGGPYRIIDFTLSNCINSRPAQDLHRHAVQGAEPQPPRPPRLERRSTRELGEFIEILPPQKRMGEHWYLGTADAVYQNLYAIERERPAWAIVLAGDHIYKMDYGRDARRAHRPRRRLTVGAIEVPVCEAGALRRAARSTTDARVVGFRRSRTFRRSVPWSPGTLPRLDGRLHLQHRSADLRPATRRRVGLDPRLRPRHHPAWWARANASSPTCSGREQEGGAVLARRRHARRLLTRRRWTSSRWTRVFNLYDPDWPLRTYQPQLPPAKFVFDEEGRRGVATSSIVSHGLHRLGRDGRRSILSPGVRVHSYCEVEDSILMPGATVGRHARVRRAIVDRGVELPQGAPRRLRSGRGPPAAHVSEGGSSVVTPGELVDRRIAADPS